MRLVPIAALLLSLCGCASTPSLAPREYLDEETAATIKVVAEPLVFAQEPGGAARDYLNVYAIDVNRMGSHEQLLAVLQWWPAESAGSANLELEISDRKLSLRAAEQSARELGISQTIDTSAPRDARWRYFPITREQLALIAAASPTRATIIEGERRTSYALWRDGRAQLAELAGDLP